MRASIAALLALFLSSPLHAGVITQVGSFDFSSSFGPGAGSAAFPGFLFESFPGNLGSLTHVDVSIQGVVQVSGFLPSNLFCGVFGCIGQPYPISLSVEHDYGLGFLLDPEIFYSGQHDGAATQPFGSVTSYSHAMSFTEITDLVGIAAVSSSAVPGAPIGTAVANVIPAFGATSRRSDFETPIPDTPLPLPFLSPRFEFLASGSAPQGPFQGIIRSAGAITLTYVFEDAVAVPAPGCGLILTGALVWLGFARRRASGSRLR
jgi:hypothetical protein